MEEQLEDDRRFDASQYAFFGGDVSQEIELGGLDEEDDVTLGGVLEEEEEGLLGLTEKDEVEAIDNVSNLDDVSVDISEKSQERRKKAAHRHRRDLKLKENDWVLLRFEKARLRKKKGKERLYPKLSMRYYGPFQITERINDVSFRLRLPDTWKIHNAFHVSLLKPFRGDVPDDGEPDEQPDVEENEKILVPEHILAHKDTKTKGKVRRRFLVKFKNYPALDAKWMEEEDLADTPQTVKLCLEAFGLA
ncbi:hypothetical protein L7F22_066591 [Adiantum nelumboides]|nr:hypothetical protein [Adiantum nelumboides]